MGACFFERVSTPCPLLGCFVNKRLSSASLALPCGGQLGLLSSTAPMCRALLIQFDRRIDAAGAAVLTSAMVWAQGAVVFHAC